MTIHDLWIKFKSFGRQTDVLLGVIIVVVAGVSFFLGRVSVSESLSTFDITQQKSQLVNKATETQDSSLNTTDVVSTREDAIQAPKGTIDAETYVASKNGTKYHLPWCSGAKRIKEENKIYFKTKDEAEKAGYEPAGNCKGI